MSILNLKSCIEHDSWFYPAILNILNLPPAAGVFYSVTSSHLDMHLNYRSWKVPSLIISMVITCYTMLYLLLHFYVLYIYIYIPWASISQQKGWYGKYHNFGGQSQVLVILGPRILSEKEHIPIIWSNIHHITLTSSHPSNNQSIGGKNFHSDPFSLHLRPLPFIFELVAISCLVLSHLVSTGGNIKQIECFYGFTFYGFTFYGFTK